MKILHTSSIQSLSHGNVHFMSDYSAPSSYSQSTQNNLSNNGSSMNPKRFKKFFKNSRTLPFIVIIGLVGVIAIVSLVNVMGNSSSSAASLISSNDRVKIDGPTAQQALNKSFNYPLKDAEGKTVSQLKYEIQNVELRDEIIVKGQRANSVEGRTFLILNVKITNTFDKSIQLNSKDYVRLIVGSSPEKLAADIHNDPVDVQAISTKYTRLGFPINENEKSLTLQVGEITGQKETIKLDLK